MTLRLVALMSFVLLLSLAAFAWLINRHQRAVMGEVERAVSDAGRATLLQWESWQGGQPGAGPHAFAFSLPAGAAGPGEGGQPARPAGPPAPASRSKSGFA